MKLPTPIKNVLIETTISTYTENYPSSRINENPLTFEIPLSSILEDTNIFDIINSDIQATISENPDSLTYIEDQNVVQFTPHFTRKCKLYDAVLNNIQAETANYPKTTINYDLAIKEELIYHFFAGSIVLMIRNAQSEITQLEFALKVGGSKLRTIIDETGGWIYIFPKFIMQSQECGKLSAKNTNAPKILADFLDEMFPKE
jgi:hypothetical protein